MVAKLKIKLFSRVTQQALSPILYSDPAACFAIHDVLYGAFERDQNIRNIFVKSV
jgi:hypothetical protein